MVVRTYLAHRQDTRTVRQQGHNHNKQDYRVSRHNHFTDYTYRHSLQSLYIPLLTAVALTAMQKTPSHVAHLL